MIKLNISENTKWLLGIIVAIFLAIFGYLSTSSEKMLTYKVVSSTELIDSKASFKDLEILI